MAWLARTCCPCGPPYGSMSTGSRAEPGRCQDGSSSAVLIPRSPAAKMSGRGSGSSGRSATTASLATSRSPGVPLPASARGPRSTRTVGSADARFLVVITVVPPARWPVEIPGPSLTCSRRPSP